ncbi:DUF1651 domain-containing protein [Prochlorococcus marinus]|uniref:Uncharacterized protein n=1 Tax=Prochlorococcus marinus (strain MIT 9211) TaxID=93059 RepID=A9BA74_PROM4|nr:DUF1651 domain-containing protein [Prochlorococcus marinus]ABX08736.1 Hypothetical protein P9211_08051 [Prochlorococcus marinus str. MIT 9211]
MGAKKALDIPDGWLLDPKGNWLLLFHKDIAPKDASPQFYMDKWEATQLGTPFKFKNRRKVNLEPALETWRELIDNGWRHINNQYGKSIL